MYKALAVVLALFLTGSTSSGQQLRYQSDGQLLAGGHAAHTLPGSINLTQILANSPEGQASLATYHRLKKAGALPAGKSEAVAIGSRVGYQVYNYERGAYDQLDFTLKIETAGFNIWVETAEIDNGRVTDAALEALRVALEDETPSASFDPNKGVLELDELVFGNPTDVDGSNKTDVLVLDIRDGFDPNVGGASVQGFVDPNNLSGVNMKDMLHLDTFPSMQPGANVNNLYLTAAHEYQHLIRFAYDPSELTFVDEGMSEWAEVMTGYGPRRNTYWTNAAELRRPMLSWRGTLEPGVDFDYQRAGLLTNYIAQRIGVEATGGITRLAATGASGYASALANLGLDLKTVLAEFHLANTINDAGVAAKYSQGSWFPDVNAKAAIEYDGTASNAVTVRADGGSGNLAQLEPGAATYHKWHDVADFTLEMDALAGAGPVTSMRARLRAFLVAQAPGQVKSVVPVELGGEPVTLTGAYSTVTLVTAHVDASLPGGFNSSWAPFTYSASWTEGSIGASTSTVSYDDGNVVVISEDGGQTTLDAWPFSQSTLGTDAQVANAFEVPDGGTLIGVDISTFYASYFDSNIPSNPRNYLLRIIAQDAQTGAPGQVLLELERDDDSAPPTIPGLSFDQVDLSAHAAALSSLSGTFFVSITNLGTDTNTLVIPLAEFAGTPAENPSWFYVQFQNGKQWANFANITISGEARFEDRVAPIRARFSLSTDTEDATDLPVSASLQANYPNPFNPATSIGFNLPHMTHARLAVYDLLGREVAVLVDGMTPAGEHQVRFDGHGLASGVYLYALEAAGLRQARTMLLMK